MRAQFWLAAVVLGLALASTASAQVKWNPFGPVSNGVKLNPFAAPSNGINYNPFGAPKTIIAPQPRQPYAGPSRLTNLFPTQHPISNDHVFGTSNNIPTDPAKYLAQFGYQRLR